MRTVAYGSGPDQVADLRLPDRGTPRAVVVLLHGGFWRERYRRDLMDGLAADLAGRGYATWNVEYRRVGPSGGGWPATLTDVAAAMDALDGLAGEHALAVDRVAVVGHSAGGHLALWAAARAGLPAGAPGAGPLVRPRVVVSLAGVCDLAEAARRRLGDRAAQGFLGGGPDEVLERYELASPAARLPLGVPQLLVHGDADDRVPVDVSRSYASAARAAGDTVELLELAGVDHFAVIEPRSAAWHAAAARLEALLPPG